MRRRLDQELVRRGLVVSRQQAQVAVAGHLVLVGGVVADKPSRLVSPDEPVVLQKTPSRFVSRGGDKLDAALRHFSVAVAGRRALDVGASTGGFTDCLLRSGAASVHALDVGRGQLDPRLRRDPRVSVHEGVNVRHATLELLGAPGRAEEPFDLVTADLSFISLTVVVPVLASLVRAGGDLVLLVKPQFEASRADVSRGRGVVRDPALWRRALERVGSALVASGTGIMGAMASPLLGAAGNAEFFVHAVHAVHAAAGPAPAAGGPAAPGERSTAATAERAIEAAIAAACTMATT
ncbi:MAG TPA: TlyA family RNA methyltransferase [Acidimicrobiales bacterium]|nr:TlyA family RNA methyltransferase [Acidimicrobiales bacterium]